MEALCITSNQTMNSDRQLAALLYNAWQSFALSGQRAIRGFPHHVLICGVARRNAIRTGGLWREGLRLRRSSLFFWSLESGCFFNTEPVFSVPHLWTCWPVWDPALISWRSHLHWVLALVLCIADHPNPVSTDHKRHDPSSEIFEAWTAGCFRTQDVEFANMSNLHFICQAGLSPALLHPPNQNCCCLSPSSHAVFW